MGVLAAKHRNLIFPRGDDVARVQGGSAAHGRAGEPGSDDRSLPRAHVSSENGIRPSVAVVSGAGLQPGLEQQSLLRVVLLVPRIVDKCNPARYVGLPQLRAVIGLEKRLAGECGESSPLDV